MPQGTHKEEVPEKKKIPEPCELGSTVDLDTSTVDLDAEALGLAVNVPEADVDVGADALHGLHGEGSSQVLHVGAACRQAESIAVEGKKLVR